MELLYNKIYIKVENEELRNVIIKKVIWQKRSWLGHRSHPGIVQVITRTTRSYLIKCQRSFFLSQVDCSLSLTQVTSNLLFYFLLNCVISFWVNSKRVWALIEMFFTRLRPWLLQWDFRLCSLSACSKSVPVVSTFATSQFKCCFGR